MSEQKQLQPHQQRVVEELAARSEDHRKLVAFLGSAIYHTLPEAEKQRLWRQEFILRSLCDVLLERINAF